MFKYCTILQTSSPLPLAEWYYASPVSWVRFPDCIANFGFLSCLVLFPSDKTHFAYRNCVVLGDCHPVSSYGALRVLHYTVTGSVLNSLTVRITVKRLSRDRLNAVTCRHGKTVHFWNKPCPASLLEASFGLSPACSCYHDEY